LIQQFKLVVKDRLFYNRFEYSIGFHLDEVSCLRDLDHDKIDRMIERRIAWREISQHRINSNNATSSLFGQSYNIIARRNKDITEQTQSDLHGLAEVLLTVNSDYKLVVSVSNARVYTNDPSLIAQIGELPGVTQKDYTRAVIGRPKDTIQLKKPRHQYRSYFKITNFAIRKQ